MRLNDYPTMDTKVVRPRASEIPDAELMEIAAVTKLMHEKFLKLFERNSHIDFLDKVCLFCGVENAASYLLPVSPFSDKGDDDDYKRFLTMMNHAAETIFGKDSEFAKKIHSISSGDEPGVVTSVDVMLKIDRYLNDVYKSLLEEVEKSE